MKKLALFDPYRPKFTGDMVEWWTNHGYEVRQDRYYDPDLVDWADVIWFDTCDNNLAAATKPSGALTDDWQMAQKTVPWDLHDADLIGKKVIVRPIDIEVWQGHHAAAEWDVVNDCIFIAPHIRDIMMADSRTQGHKMKIHTIPCGVNTDRFTFKERTPGKNIAIVAERWVSKGVDYMLQIALKLKQIDPEYKIFWLGKNNDYHWERAYLDDFILRNQLNVELQEEHVEDLNAWLEDKNYILSCSKKEAFGYNIAEAMAKGIKPVIHHFYGAEHIWPGITWSGVDQAVEMITEDHYDSQAYHQYLFDHGYTLNQMMVKFEEIINA